MKQQVSRVVLAVILKSCGLWIAQHIHPLSTWFTLTTPAELSRSVYSPPSLRHSQPIIADEPLGNLPSFLCVLHALCLSFFSLVFSQITPSSAQLNSAAVPCRVVAVPCYAFSFEHIERSTWYVCTYMHAASELFSWGMQLLASASRLSAPNFFDDLFRSILPCDRYTKPLAC